MKSPSCLPSAAAEARSGLAEFPLSERAVARQIEGEGFGALVSFSGRVRRLEHGREISAIIYEAYEKMALLELERIRVEAEGRFPVKAALWHRVGRVPVGQSAVVVACAGKHRPEAFAACEFAIAQVKSRAPIWKAAFE
jgi:molybdopterin synthase catalytic subunit